MLKPLWVGDAQAGVLWRRRHVVDFPVSRSRHVPRALTVLVGRRATPRIKLSSPIESSHRQASSLSRFMSKTLKIHILRRHSQWTARRKRQSKRMKKCNFGLGHRAVTASLKHQSFMLLARWAEAGRRCTEVKALACRNSYVDA